MSRPRVKRPSEWAIKAAGKSRLAKRLHSLPPDALQIQLFNYICEYTRLMPDHLPTYQMMLDAVGRRSTNSVRHALTQLVNVGWVIEETNDKAELTGKYKPATAVFTDNAMELYNWYRDYYLEHHVLPSYTDICAALGYKSKSSAYRYLHELVKGGLLIEVVVNGVSTHQYRPFDCGVIDYTRYEQFERELAASRHG